MISLEYLSSSAVSNMVSTSIFQSRCGWLRLFWLMFDLTAIGAVIVGSGSNLRVKAYSSALVASHTKV